MDGAFGGVFAVAAAKNRKDIVLTYVTGYFLHYIFERHLGSR